MAWVLSKDDDQPEQKVAPYGVAGMVAQETGAEPKSRWQLSGRKPTASGARPQYAEDLERSGAIGPYSFLPGGQMLNRAIGKPTQQAIQDVVDDPRGAGMNATRNAAFGFGDEAGGFGAGLSYLLRGARDGESLRYVDKNGDIRDRDGIDGDLPSEGLGGYLSDRAADVFAHGYETWRDINREGKRFTEEKPVAGVATAVAAGLPGGAAAFNATGKLTAPLVKNAPNIVKGIDTAARAGGIGYLTGFGLGEGLEERLNTAKTVGGISAVLPGAVNVASSIPGVVGKTGGYLAKRVLPGNSKTAATMRANYDAAEQAGFEITRGQAKGNPAIKAREDMLQKTGSGQMQRFADKQADDMASAGIGKVTRGQAPLTDSAGDAGDVIRGELVARRGALEAQADAAYKVAFDAARKEAVPASDELAARVQTIIDDHFFEAPRAESVIGRLQSLIKQGKADFSHVERARQQLNTLASDAANSGDNSTAAAARAIRAELDDWTANTMQNPEARKAMEGSRQVFKELKQLYSAQGPRDAGGKALERVMDSDLTGEQVIGKILGAGRRPNEATLGAVKRIKEIATGTVQSGRKAQRAGATAGAKAFNDPAKQPAKELQAVREALVYRLTAPLQARNEGALIPAQTIKSNIDDLLDGPGADISKVIFTPDEITALRQYRDAVEFIIPPPGTSKPGTAESLLLSKANWADDLKRYVLAHRSTTKPLWATGPYKAVAGRTGKITRGMGRGLNTVERAVDRVAGPSASTISAATVQADLGGDDDSPIMSRYGFGDGRTALDDLLEAQ